eukprot:1120985-Amorphochlora_amoeboformis.AAC.3
MPVYINQLTPPFPLSSHAERGLCGVKMIVIGAKRWLWDGAHTCPHPPIGASERSQVVDGVCACMHPMLPIDIYRGGGKANASRAPAGAQGWDNVGGFREREQFIDGISVLPYVKLGAEILRVGDIVGRYDENL